MLRAARCVRGTARGVRARSTLSAATANRVRYRYVVNIFNHALCAPSLDAQVLTASPLHPVLRCRRTMWVSKQ